MKRSPLVLLCACSVAATLLLPAGAAATGFSLRVQEPGPGHLQRTYLWTLAGHLWNLRPPEKYKLSGGGEMRLSREEDSQAAVVCRESTPAERDLLLKKDKEAQAAYCRRLLPEQATEVKLVSQTENPLPVHALTNFEVIYAYNLGGLSYKVSYLVSRAGERDHFTALIQAPEKTFDDLHSAFQRLLATAMVTSEAPGPDNSTRVVRHGMLGR